MSSHKDAQTEYVHEDNMSTHKVAQTEYIEEVGSARSPPAVDTQEEHGSIWKELVANPKVVACAMFANIGAIMYGYDSLSTSLCLDMAPFVETFGTVIAGSPIIPAYWQSLWNALAQIACALGAWFIAYVSDRFGRRICFFLAGIFSAAGIAVIYVASTPGVFLAGKVINGLSLGMALATGQTYISEISPRRIRGLLLAAYALFLNLGLFMAATIGFSRVTIMTTASYKLFFAVGWCWPAILIPFSWLIPESPYYLVRKGGNEKAYKSLQWLSNSKTNVDAVLAGILEIDNHEREIMASSKDVGFLDCFRGTDWRRTRIIIYCNGLSQMVGATFLANGPYFLIMAGLNPSNVGMLVQLGIAFSIISTLITFGVMSVVGHRKILLWSVCGSLLIFLTMGIASCFSSKSSLWAIGILLELTWWILGPAAAPAASLAGEISQVRLRAKSQSIGFAFNYTFSTVWNVVVPYMFNSDEGNLGGKMGWIFAATSLIAIVIIYFEFPETKGRSYSDLDDMFAQRVPARRFKTWKPIQRGASVATGVDMELDEI